MSILGRVHVTHCGIFLLLIIIIFLLGISIPSYKVLFSPVKASDDLHL